MTSDPIDWTTDPAADPELEYRALARSLRRTRKFGLFFVRCSPAEGERLIGRVRADLPEKQIEVLTLKAAIDNLYDVVDALPNKEQIDVLFIQGLELSLYEYEQEKLWNDSGERYGYSEGSVPKLLAHLNLSRERFRDQFNICFVFLVPLFALKYLMRRAPDFFDWRSGVLELVMNSTRVKQESQRLWREAGYEGYLDWTPQQRDKRILEIQAVLEEPQQTADQRVQLLLEQGNLFYASSNLKAAISSYEKLIKHDSTNDYAWCSRGNAFYDLGNAIEAISPLRSL